MTKLETNIIKYNEEHKKQIIAVWEKSVRATHKFVSPDDIEYFKGIVATIDFNSFEVHCLTTDKKVIGFIGVADNSIAMLFLDPDFIGQGYGRKLILFSIDELKADKVEVNEQNYGAVAFYEQFGFATYERVEKDGEGKDYPILKMKLKKGRRNKIGRRNQTTK